MHQLTMNMNRIGVTTTLILIDSLQRLVHSGVLLTLHKTPALKRYLTQFTEHLQSGRFQGSYLQRVMEQMNASVEMPRVSYANPLSALVQASKPRANNASPESRRIHQQCISRLLDLARRGLLQTITEKEVACQLRETDASNSYQSRLSSSEIEMNISTAVETTNLQSLLLFLHEQSTVASPPGHLPHSRVSHFIQYLRHCAQLGILYQPSVLPILADLQKASNRNFITEDMFNAAFEQIQTINYTCVYDHLGLMEFDDFLSRLISEGKLMLG